MSEPMPRHPATFTVDSTEVGHLYYFAPADRAPGPCLTQVHVNAIVDIAADGTLAGVEMIDDMPPPPNAKQTEASDVFWDTVAEGPLDGPPMAMADFRRWAAVASKRVSAAELDRDHWKANHDQMVQRNAVLRERPDLPVDRLPAITRFEERIAALISERANIIATHREQLDRLTAERDAARKAVAPFSQAAKNIPAKFDDATIVSVGIDFTMSDEEVASIEAHPRGGKLKSNRSTLIVSMDGINAGHFRAASVAIGG